MEAEILKKVRELRLRKEIKGADIAAALGLTQSSYSKLERGETELKVSHVAKLAELLGTTPADLMGLGGEGGNGERAAQLERQRLLLAERLLEEAPKGMALEQVLAQHRAAVGFIARLQQVMAAFRKLGSPGYQQLDGVFQQCADQWLAQQLEAVRAADYDGLSPEENRRLRERESAAAEREREALRGTTFAQWLHEQANRGYRDNFLPDIMAKREEIRAFIARIQQENGH